MYFWSLTSETNITCVAIAYFLFWLFSVDAFFQFWGCGIHMHIRTITRVQKGRICGWKEGHMLLLNVLLTMNFEHEGHLYANCLFCIFSFFIKCLLSQLSSRDIDMHIPILSGVQIGRTNRWKNSHIMAKNDLFKVYFLRWWSLIS